MRLAIAIGAALLVASGCKEETSLERRLSSFEITLLGPVGSIANRCPLPGTPTAAFDLTGCPTYGKDAAGKTVARVEYTARAIDNRGELLEDYDGRAKVRVVPGKVEAAFGEVRFNNGVTERSTVSFRASFGDTFLWITDEFPPPRSSDVAGLGRACGLDAKPVCFEQGLTCINTKPAVGFDPIGLAYCSQACNEATACPVGYTCETDIVAYADAAADVSDGACVRVQPTYNSGVAGPVHLVEPSLADLSRTESLVSSPFEEEFIEVQRGKMVVTAIRIDGFYLTDVCPLPQDQGGPAPGDPACTEEDRAIPPEFNHLFVFNFSRPEELEPGDQLLSLSGPMTEFVGLTEMGFPFWLVNHAVGNQPLPAPVDLSDKIADHFPQTLGRGGRCFRNEGDLLELTLLECDFAMERLEAARVSITLDSMVAIAPGSPEEDTLERFGQWPATVTDGNVTRPFAIITRENIPDFDPLPLGGRRINKPITGNLRQVAFDDRGVPIWILEPRDETECPWCEN